MSRNPCRIYGAADRIRTGDVQLGKPIRHHTLCHSIREMEASQSSRLQFVYCDQPRLEQLVTRLVTQPELDHVIWPVTGELQRAESGSR
jgi:hypothetical protein